MTAKFKALKPYPNLVEGQEYAFDPDDANVKSLVASGILQSVGTDGASLASDLTTAVKALTDLVATMKATPNRGVEVGPRIDPGQSEADRKKSFSDQIKCIVFAESNESSPDQRLAAIERLTKVYGSTRTNYDAKAWGPSTKASAQIESQGILGGYSVYPEFAQELYRVAIETSVILPYLKRRQVSSNEFRYPKLDQTGTTTASTASGFLGGVVMNWGVEANNPTQTNAKLRQGVCKVNELKGYTIVSNELLMDNSVAFEAELKSLFADAIQYYTELAVLNGDGVDKPTPIIPADATIAVTRGSSNTFVYADAVGMLKKLHPASMKTARWVFNQSVLDQVYLMKDSSNRTLWLPNYPSAPMQGSIAQFNNPTFLNLPYAFTEKTPALGTKGDVLLIDPQGYLLVERAQVDIAVNPNVNWLANEMTYRVILRVGGQPLLDNAITLLDGTNTVSHFVALN